MSGPYKDLNRRRATNRKAYRKRYQAMKDIIDKIKNVPCKDCGHTFHPAAMEFDHVRGYKLFTIGSNKHRFNLEQMLVEIAKCDIVCSNCHAIRTYMRSHAST